MQQETTNITLIHSKLDAKQNEKIVYTYNYITYYTLWNQRKRFLSKQFSRTGIHKRGKKDGSGGAVDDLYETGAGL